jgi:flagellin
MTQEAIIGKQRGAFFLDLSSEETSRNSLTELQSVLASLNNATGQLGATHARLISAVAQLQSTRTETIAANARVQDADVAEEAAKLVTLTIRQQAMSALLRQANLQPQIALKLLY